MKKIWIVGASEGIGRSLALELAKDKANHLIISARNQNRLDELSREIKVDNLAIALDVRNKNSILEAWNKIQEKYKTIDTLIYCAGYYKPMSVKAIDLAEAETMIDVNLTGAIRVLDQALPQFISRKNGHIILIGSIAGYRGLPNSFGYGASKAGLIHLAENLKAELSNLNIKIQVINPGFVKTRLTDLNNFNMPSIISSEEAALEIIKKMNANCFESRFPFIFANILKLLSKLPYRLYFKIVSRF